MPALFSLKIKDFKKLFFDWKRIKAGVSSAVERVLSRQGAFVMRRARDSIRYAKKPSSPGTPPHGHRSLSYQKVSSRSKSGKKRPVSPLKEGILFAYDRARQSVVIGVELLNKIGRAPAALEYGGTSTFIDSGGRRHLTARVRRGHIRKRGYLWPAARAEAPKLNGMWKNSIRW